MSIINEFDQSKINEELPLDWSVEKLEHNSIIKIKSKSNTNFITVQKWDGAYIVIPYIETEEFNQTYYDEQRKRCSKINDAFYHSTLLIESWIS